MTGDVHPGGLYTGQGWPLYGSPPYCGPDPAEMRSGRPFSVHMWPRDGRWDGAPARVLLVPLGVITAAMLEAIVGELVQALDRGRCVALYGVDEDQLALLANIVRGWTVRCAHA